MKRIRRSVDRHEDIPADLRTYDEARWLAVGLAANPSYDTPDDPETLTLARMIVAPAAYRAALTDAVGPRAADAYLDAEDDPAGVRAATSRAWRDRPVTEASSEQRPGPASSR